MTWGKGHPAWNKLPPAEKRHARFSINCNDEESELLRRAAERAGVQRATWVREIAITVARAQESINP